MSTLIIQILCGNVLIGTLVVSLFTLRQMLKLRRAIDAAFKEQVPESKPEIVPVYKHTTDGDTKEYYTGVGGGYYIAGGAVNRVQIFGGAGGNGGSGAGGAYAVVDAGITVLKTGGA